MRTENSPTRIVDPARIGLGWGTLFSLPAYAVALLALEERTSYADFVSQFAVLLAAPLLLIVAGVWWATHRRVWQLVLGACALSLALLGCLIAVLFFSTWWRGEKFPIGDWAKPFLIAWGIFAAWGMTLALIVCLHVHLALRRAPGASNASAPTSTPVSGRRFAWQLAMGLGVPLLLSVPVMVLLRYDIGVRNRANAMLLDEIGKTKSQIGDIADYEKIKSNVLFRKQVVDVLESSLSQTAAVLHVVGRMPDGLQLRTLQTKGNHVSFTTRVTTDASERAFVDLLQHSGFRDVEVERQDRDSGLETITATSTGMDEK